MNEKKKNPEGFRNPRDLETYEPAVFVKTKKINDKVEIKVSDNGIGIPQKIVDKIFHHSSLRNQQGKEQDWV